jgi:hypothetical protein
MADGHRSMPELRRDILLLAPFSAYRRTRFAKFDKARNFFGCRGEGDNISEIARLKGGFVFFPWPCSES